MREKNPKTEIVTKFKNSDYEKTQNLKLWQNSKTQIVIKLQNPNNDKTQKLKLWQNSKLKMWPLLCVIFPQGFWKYKKFGRGTLGSAGKKTGKQSEKYRYQKILVIKAKFAQKLLCAVILHPFLVKDFKYKTTSFNYHSPRIPNL